MHRAMMPCRPGHSPCPEGEHLMVSLDGEHWLEVEPRFPDESERPAIERMFAGRGRTKPMTFARRYLDARGARFL